MTSGFQCTNWAGFALQQKHQMMHTGPGATGVTQVAQTLGALAQPFQNAITDTQTALAKIGVAWDGTSASGFVSAMQQAGQWSQQNSEALTTGASHVQQYADSYSTTKNAIPNPAELPPIGHNSFLGGAEDFVGLKSAYAERVAQWQQANKTADDALARHEALAQKMVNSFPTVQPAPPLTNATVAPATPHGSDPNTTNTHGGPGSQPPGGGPNTNGPNAKANTPGTTPGGNTPQSQTGPNSPNSPVPSMPTSTSPSSYSPPPPTPLNPADSTNLPGSNVGPGLPPMPTPGYSPNRSYTPNGPRPTPAPTRSPGRPAAAAASESGLENTAGSAAGAGKPGGMPPGGMGGGRGKEERQHRNNHFIPSDEPFRVKITGVAPPVLGLQADNFFDEDYDGDDFRHMR
jgi:uncharacterized protein YukE